MSGVGSTRYQQGIQNGPDVSVYDPYLDLDLAPVPCPDPRLGVYPGHDCVHDRGRGRGRGHGVDFPVRLRDDWNAPFQIDSCY